MNQKKENIKQVDFLPDPADFLKENEAEDTEKMQNITRWRGKNNNTWNCRKHWNL